MRARSAPERAFLAIGPAAERFLRAAAAAGTARLASELAEIASLEAAFGRERLVAALERANTFRRFRAADVRSMSGAPAELAPDLARALRRLKLRAVRQMAPAVLQMAKVQRWSPEETLSHSSRNDHVS